MFNNQHGQTPQIQATSADLARPAALTIPVKTASTTGMSTTGTASSVNMASSATVTSPALIGSHMSTLDFAAKVKDKATRSKPVLTINTTRPKNSNPTSHASSSAYGKPRKYKNEGVSSKVGEGFTTRSGPTDLFSRTPQDADEDEVAIYTRSHPIVNEFETAYLEEAFGVSSTKDLIATGEPSTPTGDSSSSFFMSPTKLGKALRRQFANLKLAKPDSKFSKSDANRGAVQSPGEPFIPLANLYREPTYSQSPSPEISRFRQASTSAHENQHGSGTMKTAGTASQQASPTSPKQFRIPRKSVGSGDARAVSGGKESQKTVQGSSQGESSTSAAQEGAKPKESAGMEEEDYVASKVGYELVLHHCY